MANLQELQSDMKAAMKAKEKERLATIRMLISAAKNLQIDEQRDLTDEDFVKLFTKEAKKRREAIKMYRDGGRDELADKEEAELAVIAEYLPKQLTDEEIGTIVDEVMASSGASSKADMAKVMGPVMGRVKGQADGNRVRTIVMDKLS